MVTTFSKIFLALSFFSILYTQPQKKELFDIHNIEKVSKKIEKLIVKMKPDNHEAVKEVLLLAIKGINIGIKKYATLRADAELKQCKIQIEQYKTKLKEYKKMEQKGLLFLIFTKIEELFTGIKRNSLEEIPNHCVHSLCTSEAEHKISTFFISQRSGSKFSALSKNDRHVVIAIGEYLSFNIEKQDVHLANLNYLKDFFTVEWPSEGCFH